MNYELNIAFRMDHAVGFIIFLFLRVFSAAYICTKPNNGIRATCKKYLIHSCDVYIYIYIYIYMYICFSFEYMILLGLYSHEMIVYIVVCI